MVALGGSTVDQCRFVFPYRELDGNSVPDLNKSEVPMAESQIPLTSFHLFCRKRRFIWQYLFFILTVLRPPGTNELPPFCLGTKFTNDRFNIDTKVLAKGSVV